jgi:hypothetical protein
MYRMPPRQPIGDTFIGYLLKVSDEHLLATHAIDTAEVIAQGELVVRYGVVYLGRSYLSIVPDLVAFDTGGGMNGEEAWDFLFNKSNLFPRADVLGFRDDGVDDMVTVKSLDLMYPLRVFVYDNPDSHTPLAQIVGVISDNPESIPTRLRESSKVYTSISDWQKTQNG